MPHSFMLYLALAAAVLAPRRATSDSDVGFPEREHLDIDRNNTRIPLYIPGKCRTNQLLYPGDQKNDWICDCKPGYLYYAPMDGCYEAYRQGPCAIGEYLTLAAGEFNPKCTLNPCREDGWALYEGKCYELHKTADPSDPCNISGGGGIFGVNTTTLNLECIKGADRISMISPASIPPGSRRNKNKHKPQQYN